MSDIFDHEGDAWESLQWDDTPTNWKKQTQCKYCKSKDVKWVQLETGQWRLINKTNPVSFHHCPDYLKPGTYREYTHK